MKIIAISARSTDYKSAIGLEKRRLYVNGFFSEVAEKVGFVIFPVCSQNGIKEIASMCSGLIVAGRDRDIHPKYYGEKPDSRLEYPVDNYEDELDFKLIEEFEKNLQNILLNSTSYMDGKNENFYHGLFLGMSFYLDNKYSVKSNREAGLGRYDVLIEPINKKERAFILEFKVTDSEKNLEKFSKEALEQIINKKYNIGLVEKGIKDITYIGVAFYKKQVKITYK